MPPDLLLSGETLRRARESVRPKLTIEAAARRLGVSERTLRRWESTGRVKERDVTAMEELYGVQLTSSRPDISPDAHISSSEESEILQRIRAAAALTNVKLPHATPDQKRRLRRELEAVIANWLEVRGVPPDKIDVIAKTFVALFTNEHAERTSASADDARSEHA